jgi:tetratricopeptide (TPR) repeat protein
VCLALAPEAQAQPAAPAVEVQVESQSLPAQELSADLVYLFLVAEIAMQRGDNAVAVAAYADLAKRSRDSRIIRRAWDVAVTARRLDMALSIARIWIEVEPNSSRAQQALIGLLVNDQRSEEVLPVLEKFLQAEGRSVGEGFFQINRLFARHTDKMAVLVLIERLAQKYRDIPEAHFAIAQAAANASQIEHALREAREARRLNSAWEPAVLLEAQILQKRSNTEAIEVLQDYLKDYPDANEVRLNYARALVGDKRLDEARGVFRDLAQRQPDNIEVSYAVGVLSMQAEDYELAEKSLRRVANSNFREVNTARLYLGQIAEERQDAESAIQWYEKVDGGEQYVTARIRLANLLLRSRSLDEARASLQNAVAANVDQRVQLILTEAQLLREAGQSDSAYALLEQQLAEYQDHPDLLYDFAMAAERLNRLDVLETSLRRLIQLKPDHAQAYNALGYTFADRNIRLDEAQALLDKALSLTPDDAFIIDSVGWLQFRLGDLEKALGYLQRAYAARPDAEIAAHLGEVLWAMGRHDDANRIWDEAVSKAPTNEVLLNTIKRLR